MESLPKKLEEAGLSSKEAEVYVALLKNGSISGGALSKFLNMDRTHTYNVLRNLVNKGLASHIIKDKKTLFQTTSPKNLLNQIKKREQIIKSTIPDLIKLEKNQIKTSTVSILEGKQGLRTIIQTLLASKPKEILVYGGTGKSYDLLKYEMHHIAKKTLHAKIKGRIVTSEKLKKQPFTKLPNFQIKYIEEITPTSTMIFDNKVCINIFGEKSSVILIEDKSVAESHKIYFEHIWKNAKI